MKIKFIILFLLGSFYSAWSQTVPIQGQIKTTNEVENIHVINKTEQKFTITNNKGEFKIFAKVNDTLVVSSIQNKLKTLVVDIEHVLLKKITIILEEEINQLDEVVVGKVLTGDLIKDLGNVEGEPVTGKSLGIPSYQGPLKTQSERRLYEATSGGGFIPLYPIINAISGRTKKLKHHIKLEQQEELMFKIKARLSEDLFTNNTLEEDYIMDYFYFVSEDKDFTTIVRNKSDIEILVYLKDRLIQYKQNRELKEN